MKGTQVGYEVESHDKRVVKLVRQTTYGRNLTNRATDVQTVGRFKTDCVSLLA